MKLNIGNLEMPVNAATKTFAILAKRGAGKTYTGAVLAEEFARCNIPFVVFDPIDVWWGLRLKADGKGRGLPVVVFGIEHADIQLERDMGARIAQAIVRDNVSCVISTFGMPKVAQRQLIAEFSEELLKINNTPRHVFIEEAHEFVPQRVFGAMGKVFAAVEALVVMGRNRGIGVTLINQRAATVNKDVLTQLDTLLAFQNTSPQDRKALRDWVEAHAAEGDFDKFMKSLPSLPKGEGWIWSPEFMGIFQKVKIRKRETFHPDREKLGDKFEMPSLESTDVETFINKFSTEVSPKNEKTDSKGMEPSTNERVDSKALVEIRNDYESKLVEKETVISGLQAKLRQITTIVNEGLVFTSNSDIGNASYPIEPGAVIPFNNPETNLVLQKLGGMARNMYEKLLQHPGGLTNRQLALMCGYAVTSGSFRNARAKLNTMGLTKKEGDVIKALTR